MDIKNKIILTAGKFDPCHQKHIQHFMKAKQLGDYLIAITHPDAVVALARKKEGKVSACWMSLEDRIAVLERNRDIDEVIVSIDGNGECGKTLELIRKKYPKHELIYAKGGDRTAKTMLNSEVAVCEKLGIKIVYGVGDGGGDASKIVEKVVAFDGR